MIAIIDNYDSFVYNLYQYVGEFTDEVEIYRNNKITIDELKQKKLDGIILSPGPGRPENAGICIDVINEFKDKLPILGVCLGHQAIGHAFGGNIVKCGKIMHGKTSDIKMKNNDIFQSNDENLTVMRYHSLVIDRKSVPEELEITGETEDGTIMAVKHRTFPIYGLQFHPESILTSGGKHMIENFVRRVCNVK